MGIIIKPIVTEKLTAQGDKLNRYGFVVDRKVLFVLPENSKNIFLSSRNLPEVKVITVNEINTYAIMNANTMVLMDGVQDVLSERANR